MRNTLVGICGTVATFTLPRMCSILGTCSLPQINQAAGILAGALTSAWMATQIYERLKTHKPPDSRRH